MPDTKYISSSGNSYVDGILYGWAWDVDQLTFSFPTSSEFYGDDYGNDAPDTFQEFSDAQKEAARSVFEAIESFTQLSFVEITETTEDQAVLRLARSDDPSGAYASYPHSTSERAGDAWFNADSYENPQPGQLHYSTFLHEIGHALGLKHGHEEGNYYGTLPADRNSKEFSIMTYATYVGDDTSTYSGTPTGGFPQTFMMYDIAALQYIYGADFTHNSGNSTYTWDDGTGEMFIDGVGQGAPVNNKIFMTIWDGGGNDTFDFSNYDEGIKVNLEPGQWSTFSQDQLGEVGDGVFARANVFNALQYEGSSSSLIENVIGGDGDDDIIGNVAANTLHGGAGRDDLRGGDGGDSLYGGADRDYLFGGGGIDWMDGGADKDSMYGGDDGDSMFGGGGRDYMEGDGGNDYMSGGDDVDTMRGDAGVDTIYGDGGGDNIRGGTEGDYIYGGQGVDWLYGDSGNDHIYGGTENDYIYGGSGHDDLFGNSGVDRMFGSSGNDTLDGGANTDYLFGQDDNDTLIGGDGRDYLYGGKGNDLMSGGDGKDVIYADGGNDILSGGADGDRFVFKNAGGIRTITDFETGVRGETIDLSDFSITGFSDLIGSAHTTKGGDTYITLDRDDGIIIEDVSVFQLSSNDFMF